MVSCIVELHHYPIFARIAPYRTTFRTNPGAIATSLRRPEWCFCAEDFTHGMVMEQPEAISLMAPL
jgi:hypothetical protein